MKHAQQGYGFDKIPTTCRHEKPCPSSQNFLNTKKSMSYIQEQLLFASRDELNGSNGIQWRAKVYIQLLNNSYGVTLREKNLSLKYCKYFEV